MDLTSKLLIAAIRREIKTKSVQWEVHTKDKNVSRQESFEAGALSMLNRLSKGIEVANFYADDLNWDDSGESEIINDIIDHTDLSVPDGLCDPRGGKRAREFVDVLKEEYLNDDSSR